MSIYINGISAISPQDTFYTNDLNEVLNNEKTELLQINAPNYKEYINPKDLRRLPKFIRMGTVAGLKFMEDAKLKNIESINIGTGLGNIEDTTKFLNAIINNGERLLVPTSFIQSTHNVVGGQIALMLSNKTRNLTYVHDNIAFENALLDAVMQYELNDLSSALIGGVDVTSPENYEVKRRRGFWKEEQSNPLDIYKERKSGCIPGEHACFFVTQNEKTSETYAELLDVDILYKGNNEDVNSLLNKFLAKNHMEKPDIDLVFGPYNGDPTYDTEIDELLVKGFPEAKIAAYKHICGEHFTSSSFALWLSSGILKSQKIHDTLLLQQSDKNSIDTILIYQKNFFNGKNHAFILLKRA